MLLLPSMPQPTAVNVAQVYRAICKTYNDEVAVKLLDLENMNCSLDEIVREAQVGWLSLANQRCNCARQGGVE